LDFINIWIWSKRKLILQLLWIVIGSINSLILCVAYSSKYSLSVGFYQIWTLNKRKLIFQLLWIVIGSINSLILLKGSSFLKLICFLPHLFCVCRFQEAEDDCTEALDLDDRYIKAYSRRATARKELGKIKESMEGVFTLEYCTCPLTTYVTFWFWILESQIC